jgi:hypothetical protein
MSKGLGGRVKLKRVKIPDRVLIAGKWWKLSPLSPAKSKPNKDGDQAFGECYFNLKRITYNPVQHKEEMLDTLFHEGLHAILAERSYKFGSMAEDEDVVPLLVGDIMGFIKQIADVELKAA